MKNLQKKPAEQKKAGHAPSVKHVSAKPLTSPKPVAAKAVPSVGRDFRTWVLWIWNLVITKQEAAKQIQFFIDQGFGGIAIKVGREMSPVFLSEEFFEIFNEVLLIAQKEKIGIRLADDFSMIAHDAFNSMATKNKTLRAQSLFLEFSEQLIDKHDYEKTIEDPDTAIVQIAKIENDRIMVSKTKTISISKDKPTITWKQAGTYQLMVFRKKTIKNPLSGYVPNVFREQTARMYSETVWEAMHKQCSKYMPLTFEGFISEVPTYLPGDNSIPWDDDLIVKYRSKYKKDLLSALPSLFFNCEMQEAKNRAHIYSFLLQSMHERFTSVLDKWCKKYRLSQWVLCGERSLNKASNMLRDCMTIPDQPFPVVGIQNQEGTDENIAMLHAMADANAREFKRETVTVIGRNRLGNSSSLQNLKAEIDLATTIGPSRLIIDGCFFNLDHKSSVKTPANVSWYSPASEQTHLVNEYAARVKKLVAPLQLTRQIAILMPSQSLMTDYVVSNDDVVNKGLLTMKKVMQEVSSLNLDYDIISEEMLLSCSLFSNGEFNTQSKLRKGNYQALIIPYCRMASKNLFVYLERMAVKKSTVIFIDEAPHGNIDDGITPAFTGRVEKLMRSRTGTIVVAPVKDLETTLSTIKPAATITVQGRKSQDIILTTGCSGSQTVYCIHNKAEVQDFFATIDMPEEKYFYVFDANNGETHEIIDVQRKEDGCRISLNISPRQTYFIIASSQKQTTTTLPKGQKAGINVIGTVQRNYRIVLKDQWQFTPESLNILPLASWNTRIGLSRESGGFSHFYETYVEVKELPEIMLLSLFGMQNSIGAQSKSERFVEVNINGNKVNDSIALDNARLNAIIHPPVVQPPLPNGEPAPLVAMHSQNEPCHEVFTKNVTTYNIKNEMRKGINRISIRTLGNVNNPVTIAYPPLIAGNFCLVKGQNGFIIDTAMPTIGNDSWTKHGFPYMSGCGTYKQVFEIPTDFTRLVLKFSQVSGTTSVTLNETKLATFNWHPMEIDITDVCSTKRNDLVIHVTNTVDNLMRMNNRASGIIGEVYLDVY